MIGLGFFWFYFGFPTLWVRSMSTSVSSSSKCSLMAFKRILPVLCPCSSGIPWTGRQFLLVYCSWFSTPDYNCSWSFLRNLPLPLNILSILTFQPYLSHNHEIFVMKLTNPVGSNRSFSPLICFSLFDRGRIYSYFACLSKFCKQFNRIFIAIRRF